MRLLRQLFDWLFVPILMVGFAIAIHGDSGVWLIVALVCVINVVVMLVRTRRNHA